jgi:hypothetical protein
MRLRPDSSVFGGRYRRAAPTLRESLLLAAVLFFLVPAATSSAEDGDETVETVNYAFATQLGSGIYSSNGRVIQIYRITVSIPLFEANRDRSGVRLRLPTTFGFYDFKFEDIVDTGLPEDIGTISLVPELEFELRKRWPNWRFLPFLGFGGGKDFQGGSFNYIYAVGVRSLAWWPWKRSEVRFGNRLVYSGYTETDLTLKDDFGLIETGVDLRRPLGFRLFGRQADGSVFGVSYIYFHSPNIATLNDVDFSFSTDWEIGLTLGTTDPIEILGIGLPRIGVSYRFEPVGGAVRFVIGDGFPILRPDKRSAFIH